MTQASKVVESWKHKGYEGGGNVAPLLDSCTGGPAVVVGSAMGGFDELNEVLSIVPRATIFAVNDVGVYLQRFDHWVSLHADRLEYWRKLREMDINERVPCEAAIGEGGLVFKTHSDKPWNGIDYFWLGLTYAFGLSGMFAAQIAYLMGFAPIILCGCPMDYTPRFFDCAIPSKDKHHNSDGWMKNFHAEMKRHPDFKNKMRSMSGYTKTFLGGIEHGIHKS